MHTEKYFKMLFIPKVGLIMLMVQITQAEVWIKNSQWQVGLDLGTLAIKVQPTGQNILTVSEGVTLHEVTNLNSSVENNINWAWDKGAWNLTATLKGSDLFLSIVAKKSGKLVILRQPGSAYTQGLILPLSEGHYVPYNNSLWENFLLQHCQKINTAQDLSLPLWGMDHGNFSLHWILTNPFNNQLRFKKELEVDGLSVLLSHQFTTIAPKEPLTLILHLAQGNNRLAGAMRYRKWLKDQGRFESLSEKLAKIPEGEKLLGASHIYLWGTGPISPEDVSSWPNLISTLGSNNTFSRGIFNRLAKHTQVLIKLNELPSLGYQKVALAGSINQALDNWARESWQNKDINLTAMVTRYGELNKELKENFAEVLNKNSTLWGGGLSIKTMEQLEASGLPRLWLGIADGWEGGLWNPGVVARAIQAGYLIGPYDSYQTALPTDEYPSWTTAHMGEDVYNQCGIVGEKGEIQSGFNDEGYYINPRCVRPFLKERVTSLQKAIGFNSWFLDCYATGMVFDDYHPSTNNRMTQGEMATENEISMEWFGDNFNLTLGSEDGNAVTTRGVLFAHGMQTPVIGEDDVEMQKLRDSPYYLGTWYPKDEPTLFFKQVPLKEPYKTVYFDPRTRIPLYQAVFHDSVITTHHWLFDNLKLSNVLVENTLTQLLYNVPPLYHLSQGTLVERLRIIKRQDGFFRPLHQRLATQAMVGFKLRSEDGLIQQTEFEDGTRLIANFAGEARIVEDESISLPGYSISALQPGEKVIQYVAEDS